MSSADIDAASALVARGLRKGFRQGAERLEVLRSVDLDVARGERVAVVGRSGSGKSSLLHILGGLADADAGEVWVGGENLSAAGAAARARIRNARMGFVYQFHHLMPEFNAVENVAMPLLLAGRGMAEARAEANELLQRVGLAERTTHKPGELSGGERQRVAVARALAGSPTIVLADEPTGNLDRQSAAQVVEVMDELVRTTGAGLVVVTHDEDIAVRMDRSLLLEDGVLGPLGRAE